jgi:hypothetical protein
MFRHTEKQAIQSLKPITGEHPLTVTSELQPVMSNFFDLKARKAAAANGAASSSTEKPTSDNTRTQPWVEK